MSDFDGGGLEHFDGGQEHDQLDQGHEAFGHEQDHLQQFNEFGHDHNATDATHFENGHHVELDNPNEHYSESDYTNFDHQATESDHAFGAEGSDQGHEQDFGQLDHLHQEFDGQFASGGSIVDGGGGAEISAVSN